MTLSNLMAKPVVPINEAVDIEENDGVQTALTNSLDEDLERLCEIVTRDSFHGHRRRVVLPSTAFESGCERRRATSSCKSNMQY